MLVCKGNKASIVPALTVLAKIQSDRIVMTASFTELVYYSISVAVLFRIFWNSRWFWPSGWNEVCCAFSGKILPLKFTIRSRPRRQRTKHIEFICTNTHHRMEGARLRASGEFRTAVIMNSLPIQSTATWRPQYLGRRRAQVTPVRSRW